MSVTGIFKTMFNALFASIAGPIISTIRTEYAIAKVELGYKIKQLRAGSVMLAIAGAFAFFMVGLLLTAAVLGLAEVLPAWAAALIVAGALLLLTLILALWGVAKVKKNADLVPRRAIANIKDALP